MPSLSSKTKTKRQAKLKKAGKIRKRAMRRGSTPEFPVHPDKKPREPLPPELVKRKLEEAQPNDEESES